MGLSLDDLSTFGGGYNSAKPTTTTTTSTQAVTTVAPAAEAHDSTSRHSVDIFAAQQQEPEQPQLQERVLELEQVPALVAWWLFLKQPGLAEEIKSRLAPLYRVLEAKYGFDQFNESVLAAGARQFGRGLWRGGDATLIDGVLVNGSAGGVGQIAQLVRKLQSGYLYHYAFAMIIGLIMLLGWFVLG